MPSSVDSTRVHSNPGSVARKRVRYAVAILALFGVFLYARPSQRVINGGSDVTTADSDKSLSQLKAFLEDNHRKESDAGANDIALEHDSNLASDKSAVGHQDVGADGTNKEAKIVTCPACKLNSLPSVKKFVHEIAPNFKPKLNVEFIMGEDPTLHIYDSGKETRTIKLEPYSLLTWYPSVHNRLILVTVPSTICQKYTWEGIVRLLVQEGIKPSKETEEIRTAIKDV